MRFLCRRSCLQRYSPLRNRRLKLLQRRHTLPRQSPQWTPILGFRASHRRGPAHCCHQGRRGFLSPYWPLHTKASVWWLKVRCLCCRALAAGHSRPGACGSLRSQAGAVGETQLPRVLRPQLGSTFIRGLPAPSCTTRSRLQTRSCAFLRSGSFSTSFQSFMEYSQRSCPSRSHRAGWSSKNSPHSWLRATPT